MEGSQGLSQGGIKQYEWGGGYCANRQTMLTNLVSDRRGEGKGQEREHDEEEKI